MEVSWLRLRQVVSPFNPLINLPPFHYPQQVLCHVRDHRISLILYTSPHIHLHHVLGGQELVHTAKDQKKSLDAWTSPTVEEMQPIDSLRETEESHSMIGKGKGKGGMGLEEVDFDSFDGDVDEGEQRLEDWNMTCGGLILGDSRKILDVAHEPEPDNNNDDDQVTTSLMRSLEEHCSSIEYNDESVIDARSIPEDTDFTGGGNLIMSPAGSDRMKISPMNRVSYSIEVKVQCEVTSRIWSYCCNSIFPIYNHNDDYPFPCPVTVTRNLSWALFDINATSHVKQLMRDQYQQQERE